MYAGLCNAQGEYIAVMDADMQDPPDLLPQMLAILQTEQYDCVATRRKDRKGESPIRSLFAHLFYWIINHISDVDIVDGARDFRLMRRKMVDAIVAMGERERFSKGIFGWIGFRTCWLSFENTERVAGKTKWSFWKLAKYAVQGIVNFSQVPLMMALIFGTMLQIGALVLAVALVCMDLSWREIFLAFLIAFVGGLELLCIGIMGEYIFKIQTEVKHRPYYIVAESNEKRKITKI